MYEYEEVQEARLAEKLNEKAKEGWEVVAAAQGWALIRREKPEEPEIPEAPPRVWAV